MKIVQVRTHEDVMIDGKYVKNFKNIAHGTYKGYDMEIVEEYAAIQISTSTDIVIVPMVNIAFFKPESKFSKSKQAATEKEAKKPKNNPALNKVNRPK